MRTPSSSFALMSLPLPLNAVRGQDAAKLPLFALSEHEMGRVLAKPGPSRRSISTSVGYEKIFEDAPDSCTGGAEVFVTASRVTPGRPGNDCWIASRHSARVFGAAPTVRGPGRRGARRSSKRKPQA